MRALCAVVVICAVFWAAPAAAQVRLAEVSGIVTDESGGVLPGVTVTATHVATKQTRSTVTDASGAYLLAALDVGVHEIRAELLGFNPVLYKNFRLSIGDTVKLDIKLQVAALQETVTVVSEAPLVDTTSSTLSGRINEKQVEELPVNGRNWLNFATLAPGVKSDGAGAPGAGVRSGRIGSKVFVDGATVQTYSTVAIQTEVSKDTIGEFEVLTNRFDARLGHAGSAVVNAITKGGTDEFHGSAFIYYRDDSLNAKDFFTNRIEPYQNRQYGATFGGPVRRGKMQFFTNYEHEVQPMTVTSNTGVPVLDVPTDATQKKNMAFFRIDHSLTQNHRLSGRLNYYDYIQPYSGAGGTTSPPNSSNFDITTYRWNFSLNSVFGNRFVNQVLVNYLDSEQHFNRVNCPWSPSFGECPTYTFPAVQIGPRANVGYELHNWLLVRSDASYFFDKKGQHKVKFGGEVTTGQVVIFFPNATNGVFSYNQNPPNLATCCPGADQSKWDKSQFGIPARYQIGLGDFKTTAPNNIYGLYFQDDWSLNRHVTLNLGVRYDLEVGSLAHDQLGLTVEPGKNDTNNIQPRLGFAYDLFGNGRTVVRGGGGLYYDQVYLNLTYNQLLQNSGKNINVTVFNTANDPNFARDPLQGQGFEQLKAVAGAVNVSRIASGAQQPHAWSGSVGVAQQVRDDLAVAVDYVYQASAAMLVTVDSNLFCCRADGYPLPIRAGTFPELGGAVQGAGRPDPRFNSINNYTFVGKARYHGLQAAVNKRMTRNTQFGVTYLLSKNMDTASSPNNMFNVADEYGRSAEDQRHRFVANWIGYLPWGFSVNGIFYAASGQARSTSTGGVDINGDGNTGGDRPICGIDPRFAIGCTALGVPNGQRVPRSPFRSDPVYRLDLRLAKTFRMARVQLEPLIEFFNVFNRQNNDPGAYNGNLASTAFGKPGRSTSLPYQPRQIQLGARLTF